MLIIKGDLQKLKNSEFYNSDCWDYPKEKIENDKKYEDIEDVLAEEEEESASEYK